MDDTECKLLLVEYGQISMKQIEGDGTLLSEESLARLGEIQALLHLSHDAILLELKDYLSSTVTE